MGMMIGAALKGAGMIGGLLHGIFGRSGPSAQEVSIGQQEAGFATDLLKDYGQIFQKDVATLDALRQNFTSLTAQGPNQHGFNSDVLNALHTRLLNSNAAGYRNATAAVRNFQANLGGGAGTSAAIAGQLEGVIASNAANALTTGQENITMQDYAVGRENYFKGLEGMTSLAGMEGKMATTLGSMAGAEMGQAFGTEKDIEGQRQAADAQKWGAITGLASGVGSMIQGWPKGGGGESAGSGAAEGGISL